jgi:hypothetical protein
MGRLDRVAAGDVADEPEESARAEARGRYEPPSITYLGTLRELTLGGTSGPDDGVGGAGGVGSL